MFIKFEVIISCFIIKFENYSLKRFILIRIFFVKSYIPNKIIRKLLKMNYALSPIERRNEYYSNIKLGNDLSSQTQMISDASKEMISAQMKTVNSIVSSQERVSAGIDALSYKINDVNEGLHGLKAAFEFGISEVVWQIEQNRKVLKNIIEVLLAPLDTQAKELRKRAEEAYSNGWVDEALEDFLESEKKNKYDFSVHISLGMIYLFSKKNYEKALDYFEKAIKYSKPKSIYHTSFSLLHAALIKYKLNLVNEASILTDEACKLTPYLAEAQYQNAFYYAILNKPKESIPCLKKAINIDINYCEKILNEDSFKRIEKDVNKMFVELRNIEKQKALKKYDTIKTIKNSILDLIDKVTEIGINQKTDLEKETKLFYNKTVTLIKRNSYRDLKEANITLYSLQKKLLNEFDLIENLIQDKSYKYSEKIDSFKPKLIDANNVEELMKFIGFISLIPFISFLIGAPFEFGAAGVGMAIACAIPIVGHLWLLVGLFYLLFGSVGSTGGNPFQAAANSALVCCFLTPIFLWLPKSVSNFINKTREDEFEKNVNELRLEQEKCINLETLNHKLRNNYSSN